MALGHDFILQSLRIIWILTLFLSECICKKTQIYYMDGVDCSDIKYLGGATVLSHRPDTQYYTNNNECTMTFKAENKNWKIMLQVLEIDIPDIMPYHNLCNDALYVYDSDKVGTAMKEAGGNRGLCGTKLPQTLTVFSSGPYLTVAFRTDTSGPRGKGFKLIVTAISNDYRKHKSCGNNFKCDNQWCIDEDLKCDNVDHCGDNSDEAVNIKDTNILSKFMSLGFTATIAISVGSIVVFVVFVATIICCCCRCTRRPPDVNAPTNTPPTLPVTNGNAYPKQQEHVFGPMYTHQGYHPMQPVYPNTPSTTYSPYLQQRETYAASCSQYSSSQAPPSYHRSYTPTSSSLH
ncbi:uncharacterized protein LOC141902267 [Tubulanus polymorphus]|uniref:uncharacterized protein LOC141902267 n=1 Tax=Tubulanus polymorphus TaxID=672921 RepID=UPI003DA24142